MLGWVMRLWLVRLVTIAWRRFGEDNSFALAGYLAYTGLLSFFPFMIFLVVTGSFIVGFDNSMLVVDEMFALTPPQVASALQPVLVTVIEDKTGLVALVAAAVGLWAGSNAFEAARIGFNQAYDVKEDRPFYSRRMQSLQLAALAACVFVVLSLLIVLWPTIAGLIEAQLGASFAFDVFYVLRYAIGLPMFFLLLTVLHTTLPRAKRKRYRVEVYTEHHEIWRISVVPGVLATTFLWFLGATLFSLYLRYAPSFAGNYGAMAGVVITLLFFYMSSVIVFFGAQINIAAEEIRRNRSIHGGELEQTESDSGPRPIAVSAAAGGAPADPSIERLREALAMQG